MGIGLSKGAVIAKGIEGPESAKNSGLSQAEYCRRHDLKYCLFHYRKRKLRKPSQSETPSTLRCRSIAYLLAENAIRPFVVGRKNWLFADVPGGAEARATLYGLIETTRREVRARGSPRRGVALC